MLVGFLATYVAVNRARRPDREVPNPGHRLDDPLRSPPGMAWVPGGEFTMGTDDPEAAAAERPAHRVRVDGFWMDVNEVTNAEFAKFVAATGYKTTAERPIDWEQLRKELPPGTPKPPDDRLAPGSLVLFPTDNPVSPDDPAAWRRLGFAAANPGGIPRGRPARSRARTPTPSFRSRGTTPRPMPPGPASDSPPRPSGSSPRGAGSTVASTPGATSSSPVTGRSRTPGRAISPRRTPAKTASTGPPRRGRSRPTPTASTT